jgi:GGDEF domain-containing protein
MLAADAESGPWSRLGVSVRGRRALGIVSLSLWLAAIGATELALYSHHSPLNLTLLVVLLALCAVSHLQIGALNWTRSWNLRQTTMLLYSSRYLSEIRGVAGRDAFIAAFKSLMHDSAPDASHSALILASIPRLEALRSTLGDLGGRKAVENLGQGLKRVTRGDDLVGYLGDGRFGVILANCSDEDSEQYLRRLPRQVDVTVSDVTKWLDVNIDRLDLERGYAIICNSDAVLDAAGVQNALFSQVGR